MKKIKIKYSGDHSADTKVAVEVNYKYPGVFVFTDNEGAEVVIPWDKIKSLELKNIGGSSEV